MNPRLDELLKHAKNCAEIGYDYGASRYIKEAVSYGASIGVRIKPSLQKGIEAKARRNNRVIESSLDEITDYYRGK
ncbi:MAG: hypothetical protein V1734_04665 [Nanoarchaeota archaeon]